MTLGVLNNQTMDERIKEFKNDPQKMDVTVKFVNDLLEKAKSEALKRIKDREKVECANFDAGTTKKRRKWHYRARGFIIRMLSSICSCHTESKN